MRLYVNVDHVATVREARRATEPDPADAAALCEAAGADGITIHLREDRRHIHDHDVHRIAETARTVLNLELATAADIVELAATLRPHQATFVPERRQEITTEGGLVLVRAGGPDPRLAAAIARLTDAGIRVSLFVDPDPATLDVAADLRVAAVELHTGEYANAFPRAEQALARLVNAARHGRSLGLAVHAVAAIPEVEELNIGHSIVSRAIMVGMERAVAEMRRLVDAARVDQPPMSP
jgi:pyridoxine 5-phosphate synthase